MQEVVYERIAARVWWAKWHKDTFGCLELGASEGPPRGGDGEGSVCGVVQENAFFLQRFQENGKVWDDGLLDGFLEDPEVERLYGAGRPELKARITAVRKMRPRAPRV